MVDEKRQEMTGDESLRKLSQDDKAYMMDLVRTASSSSMPLMQNDGFVAVMQLIFEITGYDTVNYSNDQLELARHAGKREVWNQIKEYLFAFNPGALDIIEHHKEENRRKRGYK